MRQIVKSIILSFTAISITACASGPKYSALPKSNLESGKVVDGSAIAFQGSAPGCASMTLSLAPELEPGKYGETIKLGLNWTSLAIPTNWAFHGNGKTLHRYKMPPGRYAVAHLSCANHQSNLSTPGGTAVKYGEFDVVAGKTTYIGNITAGGNTRTRRFNFTVKDDSDLAKADFIKKYPDQAENFEIGLMESDAVPSATFEELLKIISDAKQKA